MLTGKIYTRTGDRGMTGLLGGGRVKKSAKVIEALGAVDELIAWLGLLKLTKIQKDLMVINSCLAGYKGIVPKEKRLEEEIDKMQTKLPLLANFILPQNKIHIARAVCRRAERAVVNSGQSAKNRQMIKYLNRLSDYLFVLARYRDFQRGKKEIRWKYEDR
jgi:cob(I)alamin adenosyltransferase